MRCGYALAGCMTASVAGRLAVVVQQGTEHKSTYQCPTVAASETAKASEGTVRG